MQKIWRQDCAYVSFLGPWLRSWLLYLLFLPCLFGHRFFTFALGSIFVSHIITCLNQYVWKRSNKYVIRRWMQWRTAPYTAKGEENQSTRFSISSKSLNSFARLQRRSPKTSDSLIQWKEKRAVLMSPAVIHTTRTFTFRPDGVPAGAPDLQGRTVGAEGWNPGDWF